MNLEEYRKEIDAIDGEIVRLFAKRMDIAAGIAEYKRENGIPVYDEKRELEKLGSVTEASPDNIRQYTALLYRTVFELSRRYQKGILGEKLRCGLIGKRLVHSYSPAIHGCFGDYEYKLYELREDEVGAFLQKRDFDGLNVTIPYKKTVIPYLDELSEIAASLGSVNTIIKRHDGSLYGDNTDIFGAMSLLGLSGMDLKGKKVLVLGSGGTGVTFMRAVEFAGGIPVNISRSGADNYDNIERHSDAVMVMNATPVGMYPETDASPLDLTRVPNVRCVIDAIYNPEKTMLLRQAESLGMKAINGLYMLVAQAARASSMFTGKEIPEERIPEVTRMTASQMYKDRREWAAPRPRILIINGPSLNMLGIREPSVYGNGSYEDLVDFIKKAGEENGVETAVFQSNHEGDIVDKIHESFGMVDGIVINPAAYTHTSIAILDALKAVNIPAVEVHLSDIDKREPFRQVSYAGRACIKTYKGLGFEGYRQAITFIKNFLQQHNKDS